MDAIVKELSSLTELVQAQVSIGISEEEALESLFKSWNKRLEAMRVGAGAKRELTVAVSKGPWTMEQKLALGRAIMHTSSDGATKTLRKNMQSCRHFENMLTESDWVKLRATKSKAAITTMLALRARTLNITCPGEPLLYRMVSILAVCLGEYEMSQQDVFDNMDQLQIAIKAKRSTPLPDGLLHLDSYPHSASQLPQATLDYAYPDEKPVDVDIPELDTILNGCKQRGRQNMAWLENVPAAYKGIVMSSLKQSPYAGSSIDRVPLLDRRKSGRFHSPCTPSRGGHDDGVRLELLSGAVGHSPSAFQLAASPYTRSPAEVQPLGDARAEEVPDVEEPSEAPEPLTDAAADSVAGAAAASSKDVVTEMEEKMLSAYGAAKAANGAAKVAKRPASDMAAATEPAASKKPAGAMKRPAAAHVQTSVTVGMKDVFDGLRRDHKTLSRGSFTSRAYDSAKRRALAAGNDMSDTIAFAKVQFAHATKLWHALGH